MAAESNNNNNAQETSLEPPSWPSRISYWRMMVDQGVVTADIIKHPYKGSGTEDDPFIVEWIPNDPRCPMEFSKPLKWTFTIVCAFSTLGVSLASSAYAGGIDQVISSFNVSDEVATLGVSLFVLGFAFGPLIWAPLSELYGRQAVFLVSYLGLAVFCAGATGSKNIWTLVILRFFAASFGSSPFTNAGGIIADVFSAEERGLAMNLFAGAPFVGPTLGPIIGGFLGENEGWVWVQGFLAIFTGLIWIVEALVIPETYGPVLLRKRAARLSKITGAVYVSKLDAERPKVTTTEAFTTALGRPWLLLFAEPIVLLLSIYMAIVYGTLYLMFGAFPIVYEQNRGWSEGIAGLPFISVLVGMFIGLAYNMWDNKRYLLVSKKLHGFAPPEERLPPAMIGGLAVPIGLFWFAWTNQNSVPWIVSVIAAAPFGFGMVLVFLTIMSYLIDAYTIFAASALAANSIIRSVFGAVFPLFTTYMYNNIGIHWASCVPAFLALACVPFPFLFYRYGAAIRTRCKFAAEADAFMKALERKAVAADATAAVSQEVAALEQDGATDTSQGQAEISRIMSHISLTTTDTSVDVASGGEKAGLERTTTYQANPYDIDRVNTRSSAISGRSRSRSVKSLSRKK